MIIISRKDCFKTMPKAVLFDTDNTLYDYYPANKAAECAAEKKAIKLLGISDMTFKKYYAIARSEVKKTLGQTASSHSRLLYFKTMLELLGTRAELQIALDLEHTFWREFLNNAALFDGVFEVLQKLRELKIPIGIVTDLTANIQLRKLAYFGLQDTFDAIVTSEEAGADKPDQRNFKLMAKKLYLDNLYSTWMIGDNAYADIKGAKASGALAIQKVHRDIDIGKGEEKPNIILYSFNDLLKHISSIN